MLEVLPLAAWIRAVSTVNSASATAVGVLTAGLAVAARDGREEQFVKRGLGEVEVPDEIAMLPRVLADVGPWIQPPVGARIEPPAASRKSSSMNFT